MTVEDEYELDQQVTDITMRLHICKVIGNYLDDRRKVTGQVSSDVEEKARAFCVKLTVVALRRASFFIDTPSLPWMLLNNDDACEFETSKCLCLLHWLNHVLVLCGVGGFVWSRCFCLFFNRYGRVA